MPARGGGGKSRLCPPPDAQIMAFFWGQFHQCSLGNFLAKGFKLI
jgi:hypothetical protein